MSAAPGATTDEVSASSTEPSALKPDIREVRRQAQGAVGAQRGRSKEQAATSFDLHEALRTTFEILLDGSSTRAWTAQDQTFAFETLSLTAELDQFKLTEQNGHDLARVIYEQWQSPLPKIHPRALLETLLLRKDPGKACLVAALLKSVRSTLWPGNKRALQILVHVFDFASDSELDDAFPDLWNKLSACLLEQTGALQAAKILGKLAQRWYADDPDKLATRLLPLVQERIYSLREIIYETLLPPLLAEIPGLAQAIVPLAEISKDTRERLQDYLALARVASLHSPPEALNEVALTSVISSVITHETAAIRFEALRLLLALPFGPSSSRRVRLEHLQIYRTFWLYNLQDSDSSAVRTNLVGVWKEMITRLRLSSYAAMRDVRKAGKALSKGVEDKQGPGLIADAEAYVASIRDFFSWWLEYCLAQLHVIKPYRCQIGAVTFLEILLAEGIDPACCSRSGTAASKNKAISPWAFHFNLSAETTLVPSLLACTLSTYEDIKTSAFMILSGYPLPSIYIPAVKKHAIASIRGKRDAEIASGILLLRLLAKGSLAGNPSSHQRQQTTISVSEIITLCRSQLSLALSDFETAAREAPLHGCLTALRQLLVEESLADLELEAIQARYREILDMIIDLGTITQGYLCRGTQVASFDGDDDDGAVESDVFNANWRTMKEAGDLLQTILALPFQQNIAVWTLEELDQHGALYGTWLLAIEHRGAFAHLSNAYGRLCSALLQKGGQHRELPRKWLARHLDDVLSNERRETRRGAGIPYLILGALAGSTQESGNVKYAFETLFSCLEATTNSSIATRSHSLNILRVLFLDGKLTPAAKGFVERGFVVAVEGFGSAAWSIRNASLLLYAALIQRAFGMKREHLPLHRRMSLVEFFNRYKTLHPLLVEELRKYAQIQSESAFGSVFAALLLLSLLSRPVGNPLAESLCEPFEPLVDGYSESKVWKVREAAAAARTGLVASTETWSRCASLLGRLHVRKNENALHGQLLQVLHLVRTAGTPEPLDFDSHLSHLSKLLSHQSLSIRSVAADILLACRPVDLPLLDVVLNSPQDSQDALHSLPGRASWQRERARLLLRLDAQKYTISLLRSWIPMQHQALCTLEDERACVNPPGVIPLLAGIIGNSHQDIDNALLAAGILARLSSESLAALDLQVVRRAYAETRVVTLKEALLPVLANFVEDQDEQQHLLLEEITRFADSESASARLAACLGLGTLPSLRAGQGGFASLHLLAAFLQDEEMQVRQNACTIASEQHASGRNVQSTRSIELVWKALTRMSSPSDASWLYQRCLQQLESMMDGLGEQQGALFAVEKTNVYLDPSIELTWISRIFDRHGKDISTLRQASLIKLRSVASALDRFTTEDAPFEASAINATVAEAQSRLSLLMGSPGAVMAGELAGAIK